MGRGRRVRAVCAIALCAVILTACTAEAGGGGRPGAASEGSGDRRPTLLLTPDNSRSSSGVIAAGGADAPYNYGPSVMLDGDLHRLWWCSQYRKAWPSGDDILYATTPRLDTPFTGPRGRIPPAVFSGRPGGFDGMHTCDPSVIKVGGVFYLYYTGAKDAHSFGNAIGLATSRDGIRWRRANDGRPVVTMSRDTLRDNTYGAGQPAAVFHDGWFYLMFTDTTGRAAGWNGAGQFLLRSTDPAFGSAVQALTPGGFAPVPHTHAARTTSLADAFSADLMWVEALGAFVVAHQTDDGTTVTFWDREFAMSPHPPLVIRGPWREGPGLVRTQQGHAPVSPADPCGTVAVDVIRATELSHGPTALRHFGMDLRGAQGCADRQRALRLLDGFTMPSPERTMDLITGGSLVRVERRSVAVRLARTVVENRPPGLPELEVAARLRAGAPMMRSARFGSGVLLDDGKLWRVGTPGVAELNGSTTTAVTVARWRSYPAGPTLG